MDEGQPTKFAVEPRSFPCGGNSRLVGDQIDAVSGENSRLVGGPIGSLLGQKDRRLLCPSR